MMVGQWRFMDFDNMISNAVASVTPRIINQWACSGKTSGWGPETIGKYV